MAKNSTIFSVFERFSHISRLAQPLIYAVAAVAVLCAAGTTNAGEKAKKPNIVLIMVDDLGYGDLGCYGQKHIKTPNIDRLAANGLKFRNYYAGSPVCAPSRCVLMTGLHSGHAYIRDNREAKPEGQHPIPESTVTLATMLRRLGYATGMIGKWGLGMFGTSGDPLKHGFDFFFGYNCQRHAHNFYPKYIYRNDKREDLPGNTGGDTGKTYTHDLFENESLDFIRKNKERPFFLYLPYTIPHLALQVPEDSLTEYKGKFEETPYLGKKGYRPHPTPRAALAGMITRMDRTVGRIVDLLKELKLDQDTIILFTSDNGATDPGLGGADTGFFRSNGLLRGYKGTLFEGGIRVPMIVYWPGKAPPGRTTDLISAHQDVLPTLLEAAGEKTPAKIDGISFLPTVLDKGEQRKHEYLYFEFSGYTGQQAVRMGDWKAVRRGMHKGNTTLMLFNLAKDESETTDVAKENPQIIARMEEILRREHVYSPEFPIAVIDGGKKPKKK